MDCEDRHSACSLGVLQDPPSIQWALNAQIFNEYSGPIDSVKPKGILHPVPTSRKDRIKEYIWS